MDEMIPWDHWVDIIRPYYPSGKRGRPPKNIEGMLCMYLMQNWFNLSDEAVLNRLISKILVGEVRKVDGQKCQEVKIVYNSVGEIPILGDSD